MKHRKSLIILKLLLLYIFLQYYMNTVRLEDGVGGGKPYRAISKVLLAKYAVPSSDLTVMAKNKYKTGK